MSKRYAQRDGIARRIARGGGSRRHSEPPRPAARRQATRRDVVAAELKAWGMAR